MRACGTNHSTPRTVASRICRRKSLRDKESSCGAGCRTALLRGTTITKAGLEQRWHAAVIRTEDHFGSGIIRIRRAEKLQQIAGPGRVAERGNNAWGSRVEIIARTRSGGLVKVRRMD
jgi:hypothetical protein